MSTVCTTSPHALVRISLTDAAAFVRHLITLSNTALQQTYAALCALVAGLTTSEKCATTTTTTRYKYTIHYTPKPSITVFAIEYEVVDWTATIVDHVDGRVECSAMPVCAACPPLPPVETFCPTYETIETTEKLDLATLLGKKDVCSVTCEEITTTSTTTTTAMTTVAAVVEIDDEATTSELEKYDHINDPAEEEDEKEIKEMEQEEEGKVASNSKGFTIDGMASVWPALPLDSVEASAPTVDWTINIYQRPVGLQRAVGSVLLQRRLLGL